MWHDVHHHNQCVSHQNFHCYISVSRCICTYQCVCICVYVCIYTGIYIYMYMYICMYVRACICIHVYVYIGALKAFQQSYQTISFEVIKAASMYIYIYITCQTPDLHPHVPVCIYLLLFVLVQHVRTNTCYMNSVSVGLHQHNKCSLWKMMCVCMTTLPLITAQRQTQPPECSIYNIVRI